MTTFARPLAAALLLASAACATAATPTAATLRGTSWRIVSIDGHAAVSPRAQLRFEEQRIAATAGCNGLGGAWRIKGRTLIGGQFMSTMMYCDGLMEQERALGELLGGRSQVSLTGNRLVLTSSAHSVELARLSPARPSPTPASSAPSSAASGSAGVSPASE